MIKSTLIHVLLKIICPWIAKRATKWNSMFIDDINFVHCVKCQENKAKKSEVFLWEVTLESVDMRSKP